MNPKTLFKKFASVGIIEGCIASFEKAPRILKGAALAAAVALTFNSWSPQPIQSDPMVAQSAPISAAAEFNFDFTTQLTLREILNSSLESYVAGRDDVFSSYNSVGYLPIEEGFAAINTAEEFSLRVSTDKFRELKERMVKLPGDPMFDMPLDEWMASNIDVNYLVVVKKHANRIRGELVLLPQPAQPGEFTADMPIPVLSAPGRSAELRETFDSWFARQIEKQTPAVRPS